MANQTYPADFIYDNLAIQNNIIHSAYKHSVEKLLFPLVAVAFIQRMHHKPIEEDYLMTGCWNLPMMLMRSLRLPALKCARPITGSMAAGS